MLFPVWEMENQCELTFWDSQQGLRREQGCWIWILGAVLVFLARRPPGGSRAPRSQVKAAVPVFC